MTIKSFSKMPATVVVVNAKASWFGQDLVRNDPFLRRTPKIVNILALKPSERWQLYEQFGNRAELLDTNELTPFGIKVFTSDTTKPVWPPTHPSTTK